MGRRNIWQIFGSERDSLPELPETNRHYERSRRIGSYKHAWQNVGTDVQPLPLRQPIELHAMPSAQLELPVHATSHAHELLHATPRHDAGPMQPTSQGPEPHCTF